MARDFRINGECMVYVQGGEHMSGAPIANVTELGLTSDAVTVSPEFYHRDVRVDDFGPDAPAEVQQMLAAVNLSMTLVHYDSDALDICLDESLGGGGGLTALQENGLFAGERTAPAGRLLGRFRNAYWSGWHYVAVSLRSPVEDFPYRFRQCYLAQRPVVIPLGTEASLVQCTWRCIPYADKWRSGGNTAQSGGTTIITLSGEQVYTPLRQVQSSGAVIWDHQPDYLTDEESN